MGSSDSKNKIYDGAAMFIDFENVVQQPGQKISGNVHLNCWKDFGAGNCLKLHMTGKEKVRWVEIVRTTTGTGENK